MMTYKYRAYSISERMSGIPRPAQLGLLRHHMATSVLTRPCPVGHLLLLSSQSPTLPPDKAFLEARYLELAPEGTGLPFQTLKVPRQELHLWGITQLLCCNIKCSKPLNAQNYIFFFSTQKSTHTSTMLQQQKKMKLLGQILSRLLKEFCI